MPRRRSETILSQLGLFGMRLGLGKVRQILAKLDGPHLAVPVVLVAGTNGKGSTATLLAAICRAAGYRTGLYTSPHLETVTERLTLDGRSISDRRLAGYLEEAIAAADALGVEPVTSFEALTLAAFSFFADARADLAILEVGLGGRLDATNASQPMLSLITSIGFDHEEHLGSTLSAITHEKCGILRSGKPAVAWAGEVEVETALRAEAAAAGAELLLADSVTFSASTPAGPRPGRVYLRTPRSAYDLELHLAGRHQLRNLSVAICAAEVLSDNRFSALDTEAITAGVASCRWPGRLEWVELDRDRWVLLDAAHNQAGIEALVSYLHQMDEPPDLLFGALADKTIDDTLSELAAATRRITVSRPPGERAAEPQRWLPLLAGKSVHAEVDLERAFDLALSGCDRTLLVCGSIYLVGAVRKLLRQRYGVPEPLIS